MGSGTLEVGSGIEGELARTDSGRVPASHLSPPVPGGGGWGTGSGTLKELARSGACRALTSDLSRLARQVCESRAEYREVNIW